MVEIKKEEDFSLADNIKMRAQMAYNTFKDTIKGTYHEIEENPGKGAVLASGAALGAVGASGVNASATQIEHVIDDDELDRTMVENSEKPGLIDNEDISPREEKYLKRVFGECGDDVYLEELDDGYRITLDNDTLGEKEIKRYLRYRSCNVLDGEEPKSSRNKVDIKSSNRLQDEQKDSNAIYLGDLEDVLGINNNQKFEKEESKLVHKVVSNEYGTSMTRMVDNNKIEIKEGPGRETISLNEFKALFEDYKRDKHASENQGAEKDIEQQWIEQEPEHDRIETQVSPRRNQIYLQFGAGGPGSGVIISPKQTDNLDSVTMSDGISYNKQEDNASVESDMLYELGGGFEFGSGFEIDGSLILTAGGQRRLKGTRTEVETKPASPVDYRSWNSDLKGTISGTGFKGGASIPVFCIGNIETKIGGGFGYLNETFKGDKTTETQTIFENGETETETDTRQITSSNRSNIIYGTLGIEGNRWGLELDLGTQNKSIYSMIRGELKF